MFIDGNVVWNKNTAEALLYEARSLGWNGVVLTTIIENIDANQVKKLKNEQHKVPQTEDDSIRRERTAYIDHNWKPYCLNYPPQNKNEIAQLQRIHFNVKSFAELSPVHNFVKQQSVPQESTYEIISINVPDDKTWHTVLAQGLIDLLQIDLYGVRLPFSVKRSQLGLMARQHMFLEVNLSRALIDPSSCQNLMRNLPFLTRYLPKDRIILTSGASTPMQMRAPLDLAALLRIMGFTDPADAKAILSSNVLQLLARSAARRSQGPGYFSHSQEDMGDM